LFVPPVLTELLITIIMQISDLLFERVEADWLNWIPFVTPGGLLTKVFNVLETLTHIMQHNAM